ncbi:MAG: electron transport complex subunit RsxB, partial [Burkholderiales bacterium]
MTVKHALVEQINQLLPQTQCTQCGFSGCRPYAEALAAGKAAINQCPPGGQAGIERLAQLLGQPVLPLNPKHGVEKPRRVAHITSELCIGCTLCLQACPVDAIYCAPKFLHVVLAEECTGCDLCIAPCPVDCIDMNERMPDAGAVPAWTPANAESARQRHVKRERRLIRERQDNDARLREKALAKLASFDQHKQLSPDD